MCRLRLPHSTSWSITPGPQIPRTVPTRALGSNEGVLRLVLVPGSFLGPCEHIDG